MKGCLNLFTSISGLRLNASKSMCFVSNVPPDQVASIISVLGFQLGTFPVKFLGVPLITTKLSLADCAPLLDKITNRIVSWTNKFYPILGDSNLLNL